MECCDWIWNDKDVLVVVLLVNNNRKSLVTIQSVSICSTQYISTVIDTIVLSFRFDLINMLLSILLIVFYKYCSLTIHRELTRRLSYPLGQFVRFILTYHAISSKLPLLGSISVPFQSVWMNPFHHFLLIPCHSPREEVIIDSIFSQISSISVEYLQYSKFLDDLSQAQTKSDVVLLQVLFQPNPSSQLSQYRNAYHLPNI